MSTVPGSGSGTKNEIDDAKALLANTLLPADTDASQTLDRTASTAALAGLRNDYGNIADHFQQVSETAEQDALARIAKTNPGLPTGATPTTDSPGLEAYRAMRDLVLTTQDTDALLLLKSYADRQSAFYRQLMNAALAKAAGLEAAANASALAAKLLHPGR